MMTSWVKPTYQYTLETSVGSLFQQFLDANELQPAGLATSMGVKTSTVEKWLRNNLGKGLFTRYINDVKTITGIELGRWMVADAKVKAFERVPEITDSEDLKQLHTRTDVVRALKGFVDLCGANAVALQIDGGVSNSVINHWVQPEPRHLPQEEYLVSVIIALGRGLLIGDRNDVTTELACKAVVGYSLTELVKGMDTYEGLLREVFAPFGLTASSHPHSKVAVKTGLARPLVMRTRSWLLSEPGERKSAQPGPQTILQFLRVVVVRRWTDLGDAFDTQAKLYLANVTINTPLSNLIEGKTGQEDAAESSTDPPTTGESRGGPADVRPLAKSLVALGPDRKKDPAPSCDERTLPESNPVEDAPSSLPEALGRIFAFGVQVMASLDGIQRPADPSPSVEEGSAREMLESRALQIASIVSRANLRDFSGERLDTEQIKALLMIFTLANQLMVMVASLDSEHRKADVMPGLAPLIDELVLGAFASKYNNVFGVMETIVEPTRRAVTLARETKLSEGG